MLKKLKYLVLITFFASFSLQCMNLVEAKTKSKQQELDTHLLSTFIKKKGYSENLKKLLALGANPNICNKDNKTPLYYVTTEYTQYENFGEHTPFNLFIPRSLLQYGAHYGLFFDGHTPLHHAVLHKDPTMCMTIVNHAQNVDSFSKTANTLCLINARKKIEEKRFLPKVILVLILNKLLPVHLLEDRKNFPTLGTLLQTKITNNESEFNTCTAYTIAEKLLADTEKKIETENKNLIEICKLCGIMAKSTPVLRELRRNKEALHKIQLLVNPAQLTK